MPGFSEMRAGLSAGDAVGEPLQEFLRVRRGLPPEVAEHFGRAGAETRNKPGKYPGAVGVAGGHRLGAFYPAIQTGHAGQPGSLEGQFGFALEMDGDALFVAGFELLLGKFTGAGQINAVIPEQLVDALGFADGVVFHDIGEQGHAGFELADKTQLGGVADGPDSKRRSKARQRPRRRD